MDAEFFTEKGLWVNLGTAEIDKNKKQLGIHNK
jgi:hypothetical protein